jgi:betaine-aldehyde dehydrogenase
MNTGLFINGEFKETEEKQRIIDPSNGEVIAEVSVASEYDVLSAVSAARIAFDHKDWTGLSLGERKDFLLKISQGILDKAGELANLETLNTGKPIKESTFMDIPSAAETFRYFAENLEKFLKPETKDISTQIAHVQANLLREPLGVAVLIVPWNYPLLIACWKLAQALAAGNTVVLKPSSLTPLSALELARIIKDAGLPNGVVNVIVGSGEKIGKALCSDKRVNMISFTGSNEVGKKIMEYSSDNVKKLTMELGGKSASIVCNDADLESAVNSSLCSIFLNQGQMCTAMSRILVEADIYDQFVNDFVNKAQRIKLGAGGDFETQMGPLISEAQRKRVLACIEQAKKDDARVICGGKIPAAEPLKNGFFFEPTVITEAKVQSNIFKEEVFGPVVCISKFEKLDDAISSANATDFALAACVWTRDEAKAAAISGQLDAGTVWVNTYGMFFNELPYGGFKQSGFGKELGREGFLEYTRLKDVIVDKAKDAKPLVNYWYGF